MRSGETDYVLIETGIEASGLVYTCKSLCLSAALQQPDLPTVKRYDVAGLFVQTLEMLRSEQD